MTPFCECFPTSYGMHMKLATLFVNISGRADLNSLPGNLPEDTCNWNSCWHSVSTQYNMTSCGNRFQINQASIKNFPQWFRTTYTTKLSSDYCFHKRKLAGRATVSNLEMTVESCQSLLYGELNSDYSLKDGRDFFSHCRQVMCGQPEDSVFSAFVNPIPNEV